MMSFIRNAAIVVGGALGGGCASTQPGPQNDDTITRIEGVVLGETPAPPVAQPAAAPVAQPGPAEARMDAEQDLSAATMPAVPEQPVAPQRPAATLEQIETRRSMLEALPSGHLTFLTNNNDGVTERGKNWQTKVRDLVGEFSNPVIGMDLIGDPTKVSDAKLQQGVALVGAMLKIDADRDNRAAKIHTQDPDIKESGMSSGRKKELIKSHEALEGAISALEGWQNSVRSLNFNTTTSNPYVGQGNGAVDGSAGNGAVQGRPATEADFQKMTGLTLMQLTFLKENERNEFFQSLRDSKALEVAMTANVGPQEQLTLLQRSAKLEADQTKYQQKALDREANLARKLADAEHKKDMQAIKEARAEDAMKKKERDGWLDSLEDLADAIWKNTKRY